MTRKWTILCLFAMMACRQSKADAILCQSDTLSRYLALGSSGCSFQNDVFSNFVYTGPAGVLAGIAVQPLAARYGLRADGSAGYDAMNGLRNYPAGGLIFPSIFTVTGQDTLSFSISYTITAAPGYVIRFTGYESEICGDIEASASVYSSLGFGGVGTPTCGESPLFERQWQDLASLRVTDSIHLAASDRPRVGESASGGRLSNYVGVTPIPIPEPRTGIIAGCLALALLFCRLRSKIGTCCQTVMRK